MAPLPMHLPAADGGFHAKGAVIALDRRYAVLKLNGNFPDNPARNGLPTIQGAVFLCDAENGVLLAVMDSIEVTLRRTAAASALAARLLARRDARNLLICGCGDQGRAHLVALAEVLPLARCLAWDADPERARAFAAEMDMTGGVAVAMAGDVSEAALASDAIVTCTTARAPFLKADDVRPGTFIAAVGADNPEKSEIHPDLMAAAGIVVDSLEQCLVMGDLHHAVASGAVEPGYVRAEVGDLIAGRADGRRTPDEIMIFDSTGTALQAAAAAAAIYERCRGRSVATVELGTI